MRKAIKKRKTASKFHTDSKWGKIKTTFLDNTENQIFLLLGSTVTTGVAWSVIRWMNINYMTDFGKLLIQLRNMKLGIPLAIAEPKSPRLSMKKYNFLLKYDTIQLRFTRDIEIYVLKRDNMLVGSRVFLRKNLDSINEATEFLLTYNNRELLRGNDTFHMDSYVVVIPDYKSNTYVMDVITRPFLCTLEEFFSKFDYSFTQKLNWNDINWTVIDIVLHYLYKFTAQCFTALDNLYTMQFYHGDIANSRGPLWVVDFDLNIHMVGEWEVSLHSNPNDQGFLRAKLLQDKNALALRLLSLLKQVGKDSTLQDNYRFSNAISLNVYQTRWGYMQQKYRDLVRFLDNYSNAANATPIPTYQRNFTAWKLDLQKDIVFNNLDFEKFQLGEFKDI